MDSNGSNFSFSSNDVDLAREAHEAVGLNLDVARGGNTEFSCETTGMISKDFSLYYKSYGAQVVLDAPPVSDYWLSVPISSQCDSQGNKRIRLVSRASRMACPERHDPLIVPEQAEGLGLRIDQHFLARKLSALADRDVKGSVCFDPEFQANSHIAQAIANLTVLAIHSPDDWSPLGNPIFRTNFLDVVTSILLLNSPHSHTQLLKYPAVSGTRAVRRAIDYIHSQIDEPITLADLAQVSGVPIRTLGYQFNRSTGYSPLGYLRKARLEAARVQLQSETGKSVTQIALHLGFTNLGRFTAYYKNHFGETPSTTIKRRRSTKPGH